VQIISAQEYITDFSDGTLQGWTNRDSSIDLLTVEPNATSSGFNLQKVCDGTSSAIGEMSVVTSVNWIGDFFYGFPSNGFMLNLDHINLRNTNNFDLQVRYGFTGANGYQVVTSDAIIVPALSGWNIYENAFYVGYDPVPVLSNITVITDTGTLPYLEIVDNVYALFEDVVEVKVFHNPSISYEGEFIIGNLDINLIESLLLLSNEDKKIPEISIYPNPAKESLFIRTTGGIEGTIALYNTLGEKILEQNINSNQTELNISRLSQGVYMLGIQNKGVITTKKFVKI
jgi:hypothetical protein